MNKAWRQPHKTISSNNGVQKFQHNSAKKKNNIDSLSFHFISARMTLSSEGGPPRKRKKKKTREAYNYHKDLIRQDAERKEGRRCWERFPTSFVKVCETLGEPNREKEETRNYLARLSLLPRQGEE